MLSSFIKRLISKLNTTIVLRLAGERDVLRDDFTIAVPNWTTSTLSESPDAVVICIITHQASLIVSFLLLGKSFFLLLLVNLLKKQGLVLSLSLLAGKQVR